MSAEFKFHSSQKNEILPSTGKHPVRAHVYDER